MERSREARRSNMAAANGLSRRRQRGTRDSHEEEGHMDLQDTVRLRDRANKRDRDRDRDRYRDREFSSHKIQNRRRRGDSLTLGNNKEEGDEESTEESVADEDDYEIEERRAAHTISHNATSFSSSLLNQNSRKSLPPTKPVKQAPALKAPDEMIGVLVPRKARSASVKRSHENWLSGNGGFWEDHKASTSPASRSAEANSPSSSNVSVRKKMKPNGPKTRLPNVAKSSCSSGQQDDIEIEIAEVLYGLMKQSHNSKEDDNIGKPESKESEGFSNSQDSKPSVSVLPQNNSTASDLLTDSAAPQKKKVEAENSLNPVQNGFITSAVMVERVISEKIEISASKSERTSQFNVESCEASHKMDVDAAKVAPLTVEPQEEVNKQVDSKSSIGGSGSTDGPVTEKKSSSAEEESATCRNMVFDYQESRVTKATSTVLENESRKEEKLEIDLMAPPPMVSSPERDGCNEFASDPSLEANDVKIKSLVKDKVKVDRFVKKEPAVEEIEKKKLEPIGENHQSKIDLEKPNQDNGRDSFIKLQQQNEKQQQLQPQSTIAKLEKTESTSAPLQLAVDGWPNGLPPLGYMPPFQTVMPLDGSTRSSIAHQPPPFMFSQPRPKRCATHCYIARNICLKQQLAKMNSFWPAGARSTSLCGAKPNNCSVMPSTENLIHGNPLQGSLPVLNLNSGQDKSQAVMHFPRPAQKDKSSEGVNFVDPAQRKQFVVEQAHQPAPAGNLLHAPAFIFPVSQQQATANQPSSKSAATLTKSASSSSNSTAAIPASSTGLPAMAAPVTYNYPNLAANEAPYLTILQNNGYPFPVHAVGTTPTIRGGTHAQPLPFFNGSFYSSQIFHPSQFQHQQLPHSQPLIQSAHQNTSTSSASSSSHKQLQSQLPRGVPVSGNNFMSSMSMQSQQQQKQHVSSSNQNCKLEAETSGENTPSAATSLPSHNETSVYGQNFSVPLQPLNFALMHSPTVGGSSGGNRSEKQQQSQQKSFLKGGVELLPQAFAMSFASFGGSNSASNLNFSSMPLNSAIFQSLPDTAPCGYQISPAAQASLQKNHQISEVKMGGSSNHEDGKKPGSGKSPSTNVQTLVFDDSVRTLNFVSSPITGIWPSRSVPSTAITTNSSVSANSQNFQQQQLLQLQKQQMLQQQQQSIAAARSKAPTANSLPSSSIVGKHSNTASIFPQTLVQSNSSSQSAHWKNSTRNTTGQVPPTSSSSSILKNVSQQQVRSSQSYTQISFERHSKSGLAPQGQQIFTSNQSSSGLVVGSPRSGGNMRTSSAGSKAGSSIPTLQSQQTENSSASTGQKSSPVCGRNVPSILSTCSSHLSELKY